MRGLNNLGALWETLRSILPLTAVLAFFQVVVLRKPIDDIKQFGIGFVLSVFGLHFFLKGVSMSLFPLGDSVGQNLIVLEKNG